MIQPPFKNPVLTLEEKELQRSSLVLPARVSSFIHSLHTNRNVVQTTIVLLLEKLTIELKKHGITEYDPDRYESAICGASIILGGTTPDEQPHRQAVGGNDGCGVAAVARVDTRAPAQSPDAASTPARTVGRKTKRVVKTQG